MPGDVNDTSERPFADISVPSARGEMVEDVYLPPVRVPDEAPSPVEVGFPEAGRVRRTLRALRSVFSSFAVLADWRSRWTLLRAKLDARRGRAPETIALRIKGPEPLEVHARPGTDDFGILYEHFARGAHLPPLTDDPASIRSIVELGSSSGLGLADLARRHPNARLLGVEPDGENAALARRNIVPFADRCALLEAGVWDREVDLVVQGEETGLLVARPGATGSRRVTGTTVDRLLDENMPGTVDFMHVDAAGVEPRIITPDADWLDRVRSITLHVYPDRGLSAERCAEILSARGFDVTKDMHWWGGQVFGVRG
jgi:hypothetical protein